MTSDLLVVASNSRDDLSMSTDYHCGDTGWARVVDTILRDVDGVVGVEGSIMRNYYKEVIRNIVNPLRVQPKSRIWGTYVTSTFIYR